MKKREIFKIEGDKIMRLRRHCPKCGDGVFLAEHKNRLSCGNCGYTEFKSGKQKAPEKSVMPEEKPLESKSTEPLQETTETPKEEASEPPVEDVKEGVVEEPQPEAQPGEATKEKPKEEPKENKQ